VVPCRLRYCQTGDRFDLRYAHLFAGICLLILRFGRSS
jgi:hypothetical protein